MKYRHTEVKRLFEKIKQLDASQLPDALKYDNLKLIVKQAKETDVYKYSISGRIAISKATDTEELRKALIKATRETERKFKKS